MDHHQLAVVSIVGSLLDVLGALYLAYDILGGKHGPLRALTRGVTYGTLFGVGYGIVLGLPFGLAAGTAHGITFAFELTRASKRLGHYPYICEVLFSLIRGIGFAIGAASIYGTQFGAVFGTLSTLGQAFAYRIGVRPSPDYEAHRGPHITRAQILGALTWAVGYLAAGYLSAAVAHHQMHALMFGVEVGLAVGLVTAVSNASTPFIERLADTIPDRRLGVLGVVLILTGFALQSVQYWLSLLDVPLH